MGQLTITNTSSVNAQVSWKPNVLGSTPTRAYIIAPGDRVT